MRLRIHSTKDRQSQDERSGSGAEHAEPWLTQSTDERRAVRYQICHLEIAHWVWQRQKEVNMAPREMMTEHARIAGEIIRDQYIADSLTDQEQQALLKYQKLADWIPGGFFIYRARGDGEILFANRQMLAIYECDSYAEFKQHVHGSFRGMVNPGELEESETQIWEQINSGSDHFDALEYHIVTARGDVRKIEDHGRYIVDPELGEIFAVYIVDVKVRDASRDIDRLTGLYGMKRFLITLGRLMESEKSWTSEDGFDLIYLDIVNFKLYNRDHGHTAGDAFLKSMAGEIHKAFPGQYASRFTADQFYVISSSDASVSGIKSLHDYLKQNMQVEVCAGIYHVHHEDAKPVIICDRAKIAGDKASGNFHTYYRNFTRNMEAELSLSSYLCAHLEDAIQKGWIRTWYQPLGRTLSGKIIGFEALARWEDPTYGFMTPAMFIPVLEENHLIHQLDMYMLGNICRMLSARLERGEKVFPVSCNLSRLDFEVEDIHEKINAVLAKQGIPHELINIELTESMLYGSEELMREHISRFHQDGYQVWMDDFGSGYSALNTLQTFDFDVLKIDMQFLRKENAKTPMILASIVNMAKNLEISTLAEGVETREQYVFLRAIGCERVQGYYLSKPLPFEKCYGVLKHQGYILETTGDRIFYDQIGRVNFLSAHPMEFASSKVDSAFPIAIMEYDDEKLHTIYANDAFQRYIHSIAIKDPSELDHIHNDKSGRYYRRVRDVIDKADTCRLSFCDFVKEGFHGRLQFRKIAEWRNRKAYLCSSVLAVQGGNDQE